MRAVRVGWFISLEISRAKALMRFPGSRPALDFLFWYCNSLTPVLRESGFGVSRVLKFFYMGRCDQKVRQPKQRDRHLACRVLQLLSASELAHFTKNSGFATLEPGILNLINLWVIRVSPLLRQAPARATKVPIGIFSLINRRASNLFPRSV